MNAEHGRLLTVEQARNLTADANGRRIDRKIFRELVRQGVVPSWKNPLNGKLRIPAAQFVAWMNGAGTHDAKPKTQGGAA
jgi:hypothetical protein